MSAQNQPAKKSQTTLFQNWGYYGDQRLASSAAQPSNANNHSSADKDAIAIYDMDDDIDDEALFAACDEIENQMIGLGQGLQTQDRSERNSENKSSNSFSEPPHGTPLEELPGFDASAGRVWIYPVNYPLRDYQFNIVKEALLKNTLVTLPTGLGKTFIAAVVMFNFYRWYPSGKVMFMAPTKPLVAQQIEACYNIMGIPEEDMGELTGNMNPLDRRKLWEQKRVFFLTPQVMTNDLSRQACPAMDVKCLVVDEAHKALGNHAYCQVVSELSKYSNEFRILALSATPGGDLKAVQKVLNNLKISHVEIRSEDSPDIKPYTHERKVEKIVVPLGDELKFLQEQYLQGLSVYVSRLNRCGALFNTDPSKLSTFQLLRARDAFRQNPPPQVKSKGAVEGDFAIAMSLYHGYDLLLLHGIRTLFLFLMATISSDKGFSRTRQELLRNGDFMNVMHMLKDKFDNHQDGDTAVNAALNSSVFSTMSNKLPTPFVSPTQQGGCTQKARKFVVSHPKMGKLQEIVVGHFKKFQNNGLNVDDAGPSTTSSKSTRVMIFATYRDSVVEITSMLNCHQPLVRCMSFIGQSSAGKNTKGISQKEQLRVVKEFRSGNYNTLVSTCVGEEGLDIGEVDLIICFDAHNSPIRLVQRMGRTGRKREGRIVMLVTEGKEASVYDRSQYSKRGIHKALQGKSKSLHLYPNSPRMIPRGLNPQPCKMNITIQKFQGIQKGKKGKKRVNIGSITDFTTNEKRTNSTEISFLSTEQLAIWHTKYKTNIPAPTLPSGGTFLTLGDKKGTQEDGGEDEASVLSLTSWSLWQTSKQPTRIVTHSDRCNAFVELMEFMEVQEQMEGEDIYGLEMRQYLNEYDIVRKKKKSKGIEQFCKTKSKSTLTEDANNENKRHVDVIVIDDDFSDYNKKHEEEAPDNIGRKKRKKELASLPIIYNESDEDNSDRDLPEVFLDHISEEDATKGKMSVGSEISVSKKPKASPKKGKDGVEKKSPGINNHDNSQALKLKGSLKIKNDIGIKRKIPRLPSSSDDDDFEETNYHPGSPTFGPKEKCTTEIGLEDMRQCLIDVGAVSSSSKREEEKIQKQKKEDVFETDILSSHEEEKQGREEKEHSIDLSSMFPSSQLSFDKTLYNKTLEEFRKEKGKDCKEKFLIPPPPPSISSLDLLDEIDMSFGIDTLKKNDEIYTPVQDGNESKSGSKGVGDEKAVVVKLSENCMTLPVSPVLKKKTNSGNADTFTPKKNSSSLLQKSLQKSNLSCGKVDHDNNNKSVTDNKILPSWNESTLNDLFSDDWEDSDFKPATCQINTPLVPDLTSDSCQTPIHSKMSSSKTSIKVGLVKVASARKLVVDESISKEVQSCVNDSIKTSQTFKDVDKRDFMIPGVCEQTGKLDDIEMNKSDEKWMDEQAKLMNNEDEDTHFFKNLHSRQSVSKKPDFNHSQDKNKKRIDDNDFPEEVDFTLDFDLIVAHDIIPTLFANEEDCSKSRSVVQPDQTAKIETVQKEEAGFDLNFDLGFDLDVLDSDDYVLPSPLAKSGRQRPQIPSTEHLEDAKKPLIFSPLHVHKPQAISTPLSSRNLSLYGKKDPTLSAVSENSGLSLHTSIVAEPYQSTFSPIQTQRALCLTKLQFCNRSDAEEMDDDDQSSNSIFEAYSGLSQKRKVEDGDERSPKRLRSCTTEEKRVDKSVFVMREMEPILCADGSQGFGIEEANVDRQEVPHVNKVSLSDSDDPMSQICRPRKNKKANVLISPDKSDSSVSPVKLQDSNKKKKILQKKRSRPNRIGSSSSDEDEFRPSVIQRPKRRKASSAPCVPILLEEDENSEDSTTPKKMLLDRKLSTKSKKRMKKDQFAGSEAIRGFLEEEADVSDDEDCSSDEEGSDLDNSLHGFINDASQLTQRSPAAQKDMHAIYMKSIRSPRNDAMLHPGRNRFKMGHIKQPVHDIFSQVPQQDDTYSEDSFCVHAGDDVSHDITDDIHRDFENTIDLNNIIDERPGRRLRGKGGVESRAERILKAGRKGVLSSYSTEESSNYSDDDVIKHESRKVSSHVARHDSRTKGNLRNDEKQHHSTWLKKPDPFKKLSPPRNKVAGNIESCSDILKTSQPLRTNLGLMNVPQEAPEGLSRQVISKEQQELEERLRRQREKQIEFKRKMAESRRQEKLQNEKNVQNNQRNMLKDLEGGSWAGSQGFDVKCKKMEGNKHRDIQDTTRGTDSGTQKARIPEYSPSRRLTPSQINLDQELVILINSKDLNCFPTLVSTLTIKHQFNPVICQLKGCTFMVSHRMGIGRKTISEISSGSNWKKLVDEITDMNFLFEKVCLILEKDRMKPRDDKPRIIPRTKYFDSTLAALTKARIKVLFSGSTDETAIILSDLAKSEMRKGVAILYPKNMNQTQEQIFRFCLSVKSVNYAEALKCVCNYKNLKEFINSSVVNFQMKGGLSKKKAEALHFFFRHQFDQQQLRR